MEKSRFPNKLKSYRRCNGLSQKKVARTLGLADTGTLSRWEKGVVIPGTVYLFRLAQLYHTQPHHLFDALWNHYGSDEHLLAQQQSFTSNENTNNEDIKDTWLL